LEDVWQRRLAYFTLELLPVDAGEVHRDLAIFLGLQPVLEAEEVDEFDSTSALANLQERIVLVKLGVPAKTALRDVVGEDAD